MFANTLDINVTGAWTTVMVSAPHVGRSGGGSIILISSAAGLKVQPFMVHYTTSKFAVRGMEKAFAAELAKDHIRANSVHPTAVSTPMGSGDIQKVLGRAIAENPRPAAMFTNLSPVDSLTSEDIADAVFFLASDERLFLASDERLFLASDESEFVTAHELAVDAGGTQY